MPPLPVTIRPAVADDAPGIERILGALHTGGMIAVERELQTGSFYLVAICGDEVCGALRTSDDEGVGSMDRLVSVRPGAGRLLVRAHAPERERRECFHTRPDRAKLTVHCHGQRLRNGGVRRTGTLDGHLLLAPGENGDRCQNGQRSNEHAAND